jgi:hypothetical protein
LALPPNSPFVLAFDIFIVSSMLSTKFIDSIRAFFFVGVGQILLSSLVSAHLGTSSRINQQSMKVIQLLGCFTLKSSKVYCNVSLKDSSLLLRVATT